MSDSQGQSQKAALHNAQKLTPPAYVADKTVEIIRSQRQKSQGRNERCACGSGKKYKNCHGLPQVDPWYRDVRQRYQTMKGKKKVLTTKEGDEVWIDEESATELEDSYEKEQSPTEDRSDGAERSSDCSVSNVADKADQGELLNVNASTEPTNGHRDPLATLVD